MSNWEIITVWVAVDNGLTRQLLRTKCVVTLGIVLQTILIIILEKNMFIWLMVKQQSQTQMMNLENWSTFLVLKAMQLISS